MQYAVPQFTDVEDKLIAGLGFKQFGIILAVGILVFFTWTLTHSVILVIIVGILLGIPAIAVVLVKINGRPLYNSLFALIGSSLSPKHYIFHKQGITAGENKEAVTISEAPAPLSAATAMVRIKELNYLLQQQSTEENILIDRLAESAAASPGSISTVSR